MAITIQPSPGTLTWASFTVTPNKIVDPADNTLVDAYTTFNYTFENLPARTVDGQFAFPDPWKVTLAPRASVWSGVAQTDDLLSHEQWHFDVGILTGRALARNLARARAKTRDALLKIMNDAITLHFHTRAGILQKRYDIDTRHGTNSHYQKIWKNLMKGCLANPNADMISGFWL